MLSWCLHSANLLIAIKSSVPSLSKWFVGFALSLYFTGFSINFSINSSIELVRKDSQPQKTCAQSIDDDLPESNDWVAWYEIRWRYLQILPIVRWSKILLKLYFYICQNSIIFEDCIRRTILIYAKANRRQDSDFGERSLSSGCKWMFSSRQTKNNVWIWRNWTALFFRVSRMV